MGGGNAYSDCSKCVPYLHKPFEFYWITLQQSVKTSAKKLLCYQFYEMAIIGHFEEKQGYLQDF